MKLPQDHAAIGKDIGRKLGGDAFVAVLSELDTLDPNLGDMLSASMGMIFGRPQLSLEERELCVVAALAVAGHTRQMKWHLGAALNLGIEPAVLKELLIQTIPYAGWPVALTSLAAFNEVALDRGLSLEDGSAKSQGADYEQGVANGRAIYPDFDAAVAQLAFFDKDLPDLIIESSFGRIYTRPHLDMRRRELIAVAMLAAMQRLPQLASHLIGAHRCGCTTDETKEVLVTLIGYLGWPVALNSLEVWKTVTQIKEP